MSLTAVVTVVNRRGLHARASAKVAELAAMTPAQLVVSKDGNQVSARSIMGLMMLGAARGDSVGLSADGDDAEAALGALKALFEDGFGEAD